MASINDICDDVLWKENSEKVQIKVFCGWRDSSSYFQNEGKLLYIKELDIRQKTVSVETWSRFLQAGISAQWKRR